MTDAERLTAILDRIAALQSDSAAHHARVEGEMTRVGDRLGDLAEKVKTQNGRVTRLEGQVGELQIRARIADRDEAESEERFDFWKERAVGLLSGVVLLVAGALIGYIL